MTLISETVIAGGEWSGYIGLESRLFFEDAPYAHQEDHNGSIVFEPEFYLDLKGGSQRIVFNPFFRYDTADDERTHADLRELYWRGVFGDLEVKVGAVKVFWGVTESQHLVDVINQTDLVENIDSEDKLGQPMINLSWVKDWGTLGLFVLPYFRERTFAGEEGRLRGRLVVDTDHPLYESGAEENHTDFAIRWSHWIGDWDIGVAHFTGTSREPLFIPGLDGGVLVLRPYYQQIDQTSLDLQATKGDWLWKLEAIYNQNDRKDYSAFVGGFEYTLVGVCDSSSDLGLLMEYHYDDRDEEATNPFENDIFVGLRWVLNDVQSSELLAGAIIDADTQASFVSVEASRRIGQSWKVNLEVRLFANSNRDDQMFQLRDDDHITLQLSKYF